MPTTEKQAEGPAIERAAGHPFTVVPQPVHQSPAILFRGMAIAWMITMIVTLSGFMLVQFFMYR